MKDILASMLLLVVMAFVASCSSGLSGNGEKSISKQIEEVHKQYKEASVRYDAYSLKKILDDDYIEINASGNSRMNKARSIDLIENSQAKYEMIFENEQVKLYGNTAIVIYNVNWKLTDHAAIPGQKNTQTGKMLYMDVWVKREQDWKLVAEQGAPVADSADQTNGNGK